MGRGEKRNSGGEDANLALLHKDFVAYLFSGLISQKGVGKVLYQLLMSGLTLQARYNKT